MLAQLATYSLYGIESRPVTVEVDISPAALPKTVLVGLAEAAVKESVPRIERAVVNSGYLRPTDRIVINLAPADFPKDAPSFDLPIALGLLAASGQLPHDRFATHAVVGELTLDGNVRPVRGALSMALAARAEGRPAILLPAANAAEAAVVEGIDVLPIASLAEAVAILTDEFEVDPAVFRFEDAVAEAGGGVDFADVRGQETAKRAMTIAAAGGHHLLMLGSPGTGKTLMARRLGTILPPLTVDESLEATGVHSALGQLAPTTPMLVERPFRAPHHTVSEAGLIGGGSVPKPGEVSLAHRGTLFLDELPEFNRRTLEVLRQPLEEQSVTIARAVGSLTFPASFQLVAAMNPCPCGFRGDPKRQCQCSPQQVERYLGRISGPLLDRIDLHVEVPPVPFEALDSLTRRDGTDSATMRQRVVAARRLQRARFQSGITLNGRMSPRQIRSVCTLTDEARGLLKDSMDALGLSARAHDRILRVARTIADLELAETAAGEGNASDDAARDPSHADLPPQSAAELSPPLSPLHISEAVGYRTLDRRYWAG